LNLGFIGECERQVRIQFAIDYDSLITKVWSLECYDLVKQRMQIDGSRSRSTMIKILAHFVNNIANGHSISNYSFQCSICLGDVKVLRRKPIERRTCVGYDSR
jgi:hypothetical protein